MDPSEIESALPEPSGSLVLSRAEEPDRRFSNLRGVRWRVNLGILPSLASSIDDLRRAAANSRRRYALLRRRLLIDPHVLKDENSSPNFFIDNPLSQNPNSSWGQFFRNSELEKTLDQDLSRLYPEYWSYFQTPRCQGMLRRILLLWCLKHPEYGYKQGMHELLAPLLYVLHVDIMRLSEVRKNYEDYFTDKFDSLSSKERDITYTFDINKFMDSMDDGIGSLGYLNKIKSLDELDPEVQSIVMLSDSYGAESELGIVLSEKFMEHDAYCMFDALMSGIHGCFALASFFGYSPAMGSHPRLNPVLEACRAFYRLLAVVDSSLHNHLVELGVEPQYFGLRWLKVLFGREFLLQDLLLVWDEIFSADNSARMGTDDKDSNNHNFKIFDSSRGILISGMAVSMILYLRSSLLSAENATCCLQKLMNFPEKIDLTKIIHKAKSLQAMVLDADVQSYLLINDVFDQRSSTPARTKSFPSGPTSPKSPLITVSESYWEEKWRVIHKAEEEERQLCSEKQSPTQKKKMWLKATKLFLAVTNISFLKTGIGKREANSSSVTQSLLEDSSKQLSPNLEETDAKNNLIDVHCPVTVDKENGFPEETTEGTMDFHSSDEDSVINGAAPSEENLSVSSDPTSLVVGSNYIENDSDSSTVSNLFLDANDKSIDSDSKENPSVSSDPVSPAIDSESSTGSNLFHDENYKDPQTSLNSPFCISPHPKNEYPVTQSDEDVSTDKPVGSSKEPKLLHGIVQWFRKLKRTVSSEESSDATETNEVEIKKNQITCYSESHPQALSSGSNGDSNKNMLKTLKNIAQSMRKHIQVIEMVFQQEPGPAHAGIIGNLAKASLIEKGQVTATTAIKELRKISNLLSEM